MSHERHFFIERNKEGRYLAKERDHDSPTASFATQEEVIVYAKGINPADHPDVERVRNTATGGRDQWRSAHSRRSEAV